jgi:hypothetical protein
LKIILFKLKRDFFDDGFYLFSYSWLVFPTPTIPTCGRVMGWGTPTN